LQHDVTATDQLAIDIQLRDGRPVTVGLDALTDFLVGQHVDVGELDAQVLQRAHGLGRETTLRHRRLALHEQHDAVGVEDGFDARAQGRIEGHGRRGSGNSNHQF
jgi:hypothetical protein